VFFHDYKFAQSQRVMIVIISQVSAMYQIRSIANLRDSTNLCRMWLFMVRMWKIANG